jgi:hypothetical protein
MQKTPGVTDQCALVFFALFFGLFFGLGEVGLVVL